MVSIVTKTIKGNEYLYLVHSVRMGSQVSQKTIKYIGRKKPISKEEFECMKLSHSNEDWILNDFKDELSYQNHEKMKKASNEYKEYITSLDPFSKKEEKSRFLSKFIANSNAIENSTMTVKETYDYLFNDVIPKRSKKELFMAENLFRAWNYVEKNCSRLFTEEDLFELHKLVNVGIENGETLGKYKKVQNYIGDVLTSSYVFTEEKMNELLKWIKKAHKSVNDFEVAFQSHAQFEIIHPFVDGNGRIGRLLINWLLLYKKLSPIVIEDRFTYYEALENSRRGKVEAICKFCMKEYLKQYEFV